MCRELGGDMLPVVAAAAMFGRGGSGIAGGGDGRDAAEALFRRLEVIELVRSLMEYRSSGLPVRTWDYLVRDC